MTETRRLRLDAGSMTLLDDRLLEYLDEQGWATVDTIARCLPLSASRAHVRERLEMLAAVELVAPISTRREAWDITSRGQEYLAGELDAHHLRWPDAARAARPR